MEVTKQRSTSTAPLIEPVQVGVQRVGQLACSAARIDGIRCAVQDGPLLANEVVPRLLVPQAAGRGKCEVIEPERLDERLEIAL